MTEVVPYSFCPYTGLSPSPLFPLDDLSAQEPLAFVSTSRKFEGVVGRI